MVGRRYDGGQEKYFRSINKVGFKNRDTGDVGLGSNR